MAQHIPFLVRMRSRGAAEVSGSGLKILQYWDLVSLFYMGFYPYSSYFSY